MMMKGALLFKFAMVLLLLNTAVITFLIMDKYKSPPNLLMNSDAPRSENASASPTGEGLLHVQSEYQRSQMINACPSSHWISILPGMNLTDFSHHVESKLLLHQIDEGMVKPLLWLLQSMDEIWGKHAAIEKGFWAEFGVFSGDSLLASHTAIRNSSKFNPSAIAGFDSFVGLPEQWRGFPAGFFGTNFESVRAKLPQDVELYQGWFQNTIGTFLAKHPGVPASFIHHDGDLFISTTITFQLLDERIVPGTIMCFDELARYAGYEQHEMLALFLWMQQFRVKLCPLAILGDFGPGVIPEVENAKCQSACFQVLERN
jgi:hypothetical protein